MINNRRGTGSFDAQWQYRKCRHQCRHSVGQVTTGDTQDAGSASGIRKVGHRMLEHAELGYGQAQREPEGEYACP